MFSRPDLILVRLKKNISYVTPGTSATGFFPARILNEMRLIKTW